MEPISIIHITALLAAYILYFFIFLKFLSKKYPYKLLAAANIIYVAGFILGMVWAASAWGSAMPMDLKIILSMLVPIPFILESVLKTKDWRVLAAGCVLILLNYVLPVALGTIHSH
jgi:ABC-type transport system involved in cytochrome c biogenesis permease subunit